MFLFDIPSKIFGHEFEMGSNKYVGLLRKFFEQL